MTYETLLQMVGEPVEDSSWLTWFSKFYASGFRNDEFKISPTLPQQKKPSLINEFANKSINLNLQNNRVKLYTHSGRILNVRIVKINQFSITYKYPNNYAKQTIGKLAVGKIIYSDGRSEEVSEKIIISGKDDWEKVQIISDEAQIVGLKKGEEIRGKTSGFLSFNTAGSAGKTASKKIKEVAAELGAPFVLMTALKNDGFGGKNSIINGVCYTYK